MMAFRIHLSQLSTPMLTMSIFFRRIQPLSKTRVISSNLLYSKAHPSRVLRKKKRISNHMKTDTPHTHTISNKYNQIQHIPNSLLRLMSLQIRSCTASCCEVCVLGITSPVRASHTLMMCAHITCVAVCVFLYARLSLCIYYKRIIAACACDILEITFGSQQMHTHTHTNNISRNAYTHFLRILLCE